jgi:hypothetical protein
MQMTLYPLRRIFRSSLFILLGFSMGALAQENPGILVQPGSHALSDSILNRIPVDYREEAKKLLTATDEQQQRLDKVSDGELLTFAITGLLPSAGGRGFPVARARSGAFRRYAKRHYSGAGPLLAVASRCA